MIDFKKIVFSLLIPVSAFAANSDSMNELNVALSNARNACVGISDKLADIKKLAGINTAITGVGTVSGGVALGTGIAKASVDARLRKMIQELKNKGQEQDKSDLQQIDLSMENSGNIATANDKKTEIEGLINKSWVLGHVRTGTMAVAGVSNIAGAAIAAKNMKSEDLETQIANCNEAIKKLSDAQMQVQMDGSDESGMVSQRARNIVSKCNMLKNIDISDIAKKAKVAMASSAVGATTGVAGTITSALANSKNVRLEGFKSDAAAQKEKNLNTASNVLAGATTVASVTAVIFNATQISTIKNMSKTVDECEGAF